jgi:hypothetical protein
MPGDRPAPDIKPPASLESPPWLDRVNFALRGTWPVRRIYRGKRNRSADVFILSFPKCGRTWLRMLLGRAIADHYGLDAEDVGELPALAEQKPGLPVIRFKHDDNPHFKTPGELVRNKDEFAERPVVLLVRDVRDTVVSTYFQMTKREERYRYHGDIDTFAKQSRGGAETIIRFYNHWVRQRDVPPKFLLVRYEDLHADTAGQLRTLLEFLGIEGVEDAVIQRAVNYGSFDNLRRLETTRGTTPGRLAGADLQDPEALKTRKGKVGGYRQYLADRTIAWIDERIARDLDPWLGYTIDGAVTRP